jgi:ribonuclease Z
MVRDTNADEIEEMQDAEQAIENAPVLQLQHKGLTIEGYSRAAVQTYWRVPELKLGFDLGIQPWSFMGTPTWFLSHCHLDHAAALPVYVARRRMMKMDPPTIYAPEQNIEHLDRLLRVWERLDRGRMNCDLRGVKPGDEIDLSRETVVSAFATKHTIPSLGFLVWERRKKLKDEYQHLSGDEIRDLRLAGTEVTREIRLPLVAFLGDTSPEGLDAFPAVYEAQIIILELTFVAPSHRKDKIHKFGHTHLDDLIERADKFKNDIIIASHFSTRYNEERIQQIVDRRLPDSLRSKLKLWL